MSRFLIILGLTLVAAGLLQRCAQLRAAQWPLLSKIGLGRLPGDFVIERENFRGYIPLGTSLLISVALSAVAWLIWR